MFGETHKIIASNIYDSIYDTYEIKLNKNKLIWWSNAPDLLPQFKFHRHYQEESLNYVVNEIVKLIFISRYVDFDGKLDLVTTKFISKKLGIISHYLSDFVCLPHAERWTFNDNMFKHIAYESKLNNISKIHCFKKNVINVNDVDIFESKVINLKRLISQYIEDVIEEYSNKEGYENDLDFALSLSLKISYFIIDTINAYNEQTNKIYAFEF